MIDQIRQAMKMFPPWHQQSLDGDILDIGLQWYISVPQKETSYTYLSAKTETMAI